MSESYWPFGLLKITLGLIPIGFYWAVHDLHGGGVMLLMGVPLIALGLWGVNDVFFHRRYRFFPKDRKVSIEGFSLSRGSFRSEVRYADISVDLTSKWVFSKPIHKRYFAMFSLADTKVAFFSSAKAEDVVAAIPRLRAAFELDEPQPTGLAMHRARH